MNTTVTQIGAVVVARLHAAGYMESTVGQYQKTIKALTKFVEERGDVYTPELGAEFASMTRSPRTGRVSAQRRLQYLNRHADAGRCGLIVSGPARTGKTTCLAQLGKTIETMHHRRNPHAAGHVPVVYITAPPAATPRMIAVEFARFLGLPLTRRSNVTDVLEAVCGVCLDAATTLVCGV